MNVLIVGGNGGIGFAMVNAVLTSFTDAKLHATHQQPLTANQVDVTSRANSDGLRLHWHHLDASDEAQVKALAASFDSLDWLINCAGMLHNKSKGPEKSVSDLDADFFMQNLKVNALPTLLLAKHFSAALKASRAPRFAVLSARVGSISDNRLGGWYSYRASKAALNMLIKTLSVEWQRSHKQGAVLALHPGTTNTRLSAPFQARVPADKLFSPERVAADLIEIIASASPRDSGSFRAYDGSAIPW
ncbi:SDR family oxidoreductase [Shewanella sp. JM162201]|uniref:SDR family oxidoreductase n=1 Tax=Shewanella jiangmenensis TaxID=2837387 RepID=A0ABS5V142_9GAMM|nr:SDR family oxidoreductase [Shewanella jiangmenensis]MBT1443314.1 SDR family oxidoreductase [Shewanella jiangmenensis]